MERSFYFRGPVYRLNLAASNLTHFIEQAEQVDEATWEYHLRRGDYARWFRDVIADEELTVAAEWVAARAGLSAPARRALLRRAIEDRYTCPA